jgi:hypothetical protein
MVPPLELGHTNTLSTQRLLSLIEDAADRSLPQPASHVQILHIRQHDEIAIIFVFLDDLSEVCIGVSLVTYVQWPTSTQGDLLSLQR